MVIGPQSVPRLPSLLVGAPPLAPSIVAAVILRMLPSLSMLPAPPLGTPSAATPSFLLLSPLMLGASADRWERAISAHVPGFILTVGVCWALEQFA